MGEKKLTVVITTYNRKNELLEQLRSLEKQGHTNEYEIFVSDNHSDYDVEEWLNSRLSKEFLEIINVKRWEINVGHELNATFAFLLPKTEWLWMLSDDDITEPNSLETILKDIVDKRNDNVCWIKYSITGFKPNRECYLNNIESIFRYYSEEKGAGEWIFMSNNVYRLPYLKCHYPKMLTHVDNVQEPEVLPLYAVKNDAREMYISSKSVVNYTPGQRSYNLIWAYLREGNLLFSGLNLTKSEIRAFRKIEFFSPMILTCALALVSGKAERKECLKRIICNHFAGFSLGRMKVRLLYLVMSVIGADRWIQIVEKRINLN